MDMQLTSDSTALHNWILDNSTSTAVTNTSGGTSASSGTRRNGVRSGMNISYLLIVGDGAGTVQFFKRMCVFTIYLSSLSLPTALSLSFFFLSLFLLSLTRHLDF